MKIPAAHRKLHLLFIPLLLLSSFPVLASAPQELQPRETQIFLDTLENRVVLCYENEQPAHYLSEIFTPVCQTGECLPIRVKLYWTLAGNYLRYSMPGSEILTKVDHLPFTEEDYHKLSLILVNKNSTLRYLHKEDFVFVNPSDTTQKVDGTTGATKRVSKRDYVEGAIFTSLTLFQLVHGPAAAAMKAFTLKEVITSENIGYFIQHKDRETAACGFEWLQQQLSEEELLARLVQLMSSSSPQIVDLAVQHIPPSAIAVDSIEERLCSIYLSAQTSDATRTQLVTVWNIPQLSPRVQVTLAQGILRFRENFPAVLELLSRQVNWTDEVYFLLCESISAESNLSRKEKIYRTLVARKNTFPKSIQKKAKELAKLNGWD